MAVPEATCQAVAEAAPFAIKVEQIGTPCVLDSSTKVPRLPGHPRAQVGRSTPGRCQPEDPMGAPAPRIVHESRPLSAEDVFDGVAALAETYQRPDTAGICVVDGFGVRVVVERGTLEVHDGVGPHRRSRRYDRATHGLRRLVILNAAGTVSLDALRWCNALGVGVLVLGPDGTCRLASTPRMTDDARLRRTQAFAPVEPYGLDVARWLMSRKIMGQGKLVLRRFGDSVTAETIGDLALATEGAETIDELRQLLEASAAALYFGAWSGRTVCPDLCDQGPAPYPAALVTLRGAPLACSRPLPRTVRPSDR